MAHRDLMAEQSHVDHAYARLEAMRAAAAGMLQDAFGERGSTFQSFTERDIRVRTSLGRLEQLQIGDESLVFGRIDRIADGGDEAFHIGRLAISDADQEPLVVDWRAPVVEPFYRATGARPMGLRRRRHFLADGRRVLDLEDELFDEEGSADGIGLGLSGPQVLRAALSRARTGRMRDIVATVQREQDEIIRSPLGGVLVVQGGPGTGKTAVALHRAAYLLYTHRFPLEGQGVLVVGPNPTFLRYIGHVLPSLGESGVELSTISGLYSHSRATAVERPGTARMKGDARMARVLARAVADRQRPLRRTVEVPYGSAVLRLTAEASSQIVAAARRRPGTHNARRRTVESLLWRHLLDEVVRRIAATRTDSDVAGASWLATHGGPTGTNGERRTGAEGVGGEDGLTARELGAELRREPTVAAALDRMWPVLTAEELLHDLFGAAPLLDLAGRSTLDPEERSALLRPRSASSGAVAWTNADLPLLDEARALLGPPRRRSGPDDPDDIRTFGHIVVDEAQDLSPMQLRMLARRSLGGSMTIVGDIAQATGSWAPADWGEVAAHLPTERGWRQVQLTVNYRTPHEIMAVAARVLAEAAPTMAAPDAVRDSGEPVRVVTVAPAATPTADPAPAADPAPSADPAPAARPAPVATCDADTPRDGRSGDGDAPTGVVPGAPELNATVAAVAVEETVALEGGAGGDGRLAVIAPPSLLDGLAAALRAAGVDAGAGHDAALDARATLLAVEEAKGLEFDAVVVVEPSVLADEAAQGLRSVYVALTRATRRLAIVHAMPLPASLADAGTDAAPAATVGAGSPLSDR